MNGIFSATFKGKKYRIVFHHGLGWIDTRIGIEETAVILNIHPESVRRLIRQGRLPAERCGKKYLLHKSLVQSFKKTYVPKRGPKKKVKNE